MVNRCNSKDKDAKFMYNITHAVYKDNMPACGPALPLVNPRSEYRFFIFNFNMLPGPGRRAVAEKPIRE